MQHSEAVKDDKTTFQAAALTQSLTYNLHITDDDDDDDDDKMVSDISDVTYSLIYDPSLTQ